jgi:hypothetical protein
MSDDELFVADDIPNVLHELSDINKNIARLESQEESSTRQGQELESLRTRKADLMKVMELINVRLETRKMEVELESRKLEEQQKQRELEELNALEECQILLLKTRTELTNCNHETEKAKLREKLAELEIRETSRKSKLAALQTSPEGGHFQLNRDRTVC